MKSSSSKWILLVVIFLSILGLIYLLVFNQYRIGYVDSSKLLSEYNAMKDARKAFESKELIWKNNIDSLTREIQTLISDYNLEISAGRSGNSYKSRIGDKQKELQNYQIAVSRNASEEETKLTQDVLKTINIFIEKFGKQNRYDIIHVAVNGNIAYANSSLDLTDEIIEALNTSYIKPQ